MGERICMKPKLTPWQKIVIAGNKGTGLRLTAKEVGELWMDDAICTRAANDSNELDSAPMALRLKPSKTKSLTP